MPTRSPDSPPPTASNPVAPAKASRRKPGRAPLTCSSGDGSSCDDPLHRLTGDLGDEIEVVVVVQHHELGRLGGGSDQQVGDLGSPVLTSFGERVLHGDGAVEYRLI